MLIEHDALKEVYRLDRSNVPKKEITGKTPVNWRKVSVWRHFFAKFIQKISFQLMWHE
jgi:hypothetical protein